MTKKQLFYVIAHFGLDLSSIYQKCHLKELKINRQIIDFSTNENN